MNNALILFYLTSGMFMGWSLGANQMGNIFGAAVGTQMVSFRTAAIIASIFFIIGSVFGGGGAAATVGKLGDIKELAGAFVAALAAALSVFLVTKAGVPVSTTQATVGSIIGWSLFKGAPIDPEIISKIVLAWVMSPLLSGVFAMCLMTFVKWYLRRFPIPLLKLDTYVRMALIVTGAFGAYSSGANNIGNVMGVFVNASPFKDINIFNVYTLSSVQQLFLVGGIAIAVGIFTYSYKTIATVGKNLLDLTPLSAWVVVTAHSVVLFVFASRSLKDFLESMGLPSLPLVPVSSSEAIIGAIVGIALLRKGRGLKWKSLKKVAYGWLTSPIISISVSFIMMFVMQNLFNQKV